MKELAEFNLEDKEARLRYFFFLAITFYASPNRHHSRAVVAAVNIARHLLYTKANHENLKMFSLSPLNKWVRKQDKRSIIVRLDFVYKKYADNVVAKRLIEFYQCTTGIPYLEQCNVLFSIFHP